MEVVVELPTMQWLVIVHEVPEVQDAELILEHFVETTKVTPQEQVRHRTVEHTAVVRGGGAKAAIVGLVMFPRFQPCGRVRRMKQSCCRTRSLQQCFASVTKIGRTEDAAMPSYC